MWLPETIARPPAAAAQWLQVACVCSGSAAGGRASVATEMGERAAEGAASLRWHFDGDVSVWSPEGTALLPSCRTLVC